jgi:integrase
MKRNETESNPVSRSSSRRSRYHKVLDNRKHPIRGLWRRNGSFVARLKVEQPDGQKELKWVKLNATTTAEAVEEMKTLHVERRENRLRHIGRAPKLADIITGYVASLDASGKRQTTIRKECGCLTRWSDKLGHWRLDQLRPHHLTGFLDGLKKDGYSGRTINIYLIALRHVMKRAKRDGFLKTLPTADIEWQKSDTKKRELVAPVELDTICETAKEASKNGRQLADYLRFLAYSGARRNEALTLRWQDVDFDRKQLTIGADGSAKNRKPRHVDVIPALEAHLRDMFSRRAPDSQWLFPSPQRGEQDIAARSFMESLRLTRDLLPDKLKRVGFHDCRHFFISFCVMSGVPAMTIAAWVGHADGGLLIGKVYGHLNDEHRRAQAARVVFTPTVMAEQATNS